MASPSTSNAIGASSPQPDLFGLLGLAPTFEVDLSVLEAAFFAHSKEFHPDRFASAPAAERVVALTKSRALNDAYQTLKKPIPRAEYLLARAGHSIGDKERLDPTFLMEILELREALAEARHAGKTDVVAARQAEMAARKKSVLGELPALFAANDWAQIKHRLIVLRYLGRYLDECAAALDDE